VLDTLMPQVVGSGTGDGIAAVAKRFVRENSLLRSYGWHGVGVLLVDIFGRFAWNDA